MDKVFVFTNSYPYGNGYNWLDSEIAVFQKNFNEVRIFPFSYEGNFQAKKIKEAENLVVSKPLLNDDYEEPSLLKLKGLVTKRLFFYLREFFTERIYSNRYWVKTWLLSSLKTEFLFQSDLIHILESVKNKEEVVLYFYWGNNQTLLVPFLRRMGFEKIIVRFHGFDLYKERLGGYQPFRRPLLKSLTTAATIAQYGSDYLKKEYTNIKFKTEVLRLGVKDFGRAEKSTDGKLRIISCARIIKLKRIDLIARVLKMLPYDIEWTHIGDGDYLHLVEHELLELPENLKVTMLGWMSADEATQYYRDNLVDLFISLSESEGIPVTIMESLAAGVPVITTDVGGISEIVDEKVGTLMDSHNSEELFVQQISDFISSYLNNTETYRDASYDRFMQLCDQKHWNRQLLKELKA